MSRLPKNECTEEGPEIRVFQVRQLESLPIVPADIKRATQRDQVLSKVLQYSRGGWPTSSTEVFRPYSMRRQEISIEDGCLLWGMRVIIPTSLREKSLVELHRDHPGVVKMKSLARSHMWWPGMDAEIERVAKSCDACHEAKKAPAKAPLNPWSWPDKPWQRVHLDYAGTFMGKFFLLAIDAHCKWGEVFEINTTTTSKTIEILRRLFTAYGLPQQLVTDNGPQFTSEEFAAFTRGNGILHTCCIPYHPASNGEAEHFVRTFKEAMKAGRHDVIPFSHRLQSFLLTYRSTPHSTTNRAPCELFLGRRVRTRLDLLRPSVEDHVCRKQARQKEQHDWHARQREFEVDQKVMVKSRRPGPANWIPGRIVQRFGPLVYEVNVGKDQTWRCHIDQLKFRYPPLSLILTLVLNLNRHQQRSLLQLRNSLLTQGMCLHQMIPLKKRLPIHLSHRSPK